MGNVFCALLMELMPSKLCVIVKALYKILKNITTFESTGSTSSVYAQHKDMIICFSRELGNGSMEVMVVYLQKMKLDTNRRMVQEDKRLM